MLLRNLKLYDFRSYSETALSFGDGIHVIFGENGAGKTTILEAIYVLALTRSFRASLDKHLIRHAQTLFRVHGEFTTPQGHQLNTILAYSRDNGKHLTVNGQRALKFSEYIGDVPLVLLHPADLELSQGEPRQRRRFLDVLLSQSDRQYLHHLIEYNRTLRQRNQVLQGRHHDEALLAAWDEQLISHGAEILQRRHEAVEQLSDRVRVLYGALSDKADQVRISYRGTIRLSEGETLPEGFRRSLLEKRQREWEQGTTVIGPHGDDVNFTMNEQPVKMFASQGEHKTLVIALKLAEFQHLQHQRHQAPILLFDDIFGELDGNRIRLMLAQLSDIGQVFVTTTSRNFFDKVSDFETPTHYYEVSGKGRISPVTVH